MKTTVLDRAGDSFEGTREMAEHCRAMIAKHETHIHQYLEDMSEIRDCVWSPPRGWTNLS